MSVADSLGTALSGRYVIDRSGGIEVAFADFVFGDREPLVRLLMTDAGQRRWHEQYLFGCNPLLDPLWSDERFQAAMQKLTVEPCRLARPWPIPPRPRPK